MNRAPGKISTLRRETAVSLGAGFTVCIITLVAGIIVFAPRSSQWSARESALVLPVTEIGFDSLAGYYETLGRGQVVATFTQVLRQQHFQASAAEGARLSATERRGLHATIQVVSDSAVIDVVVTASKRYIAERTAIGIVAEAQDYLGKLSLPFRLVVLGSAEGAAKRSTPAKLPLVPVAGVFAVITGIGTQQAARQVLRRRSVRCQPTPGPQASARIPGRWWSSSDARQVEGPGSVRAMAASLVLAAVVLFATLALGFLLVPLTRASWVAQASGVVVVSRSDGGPFAIAYQYDVLTRRFTMATYSAIIGDESFEREAARELGLGAADRRATQLTVAASPTSGVITASAEAPNAQVAEGMTRLTLERGMRYVESLHTLFVVNPAASTKAEPVSRFRVVPILTLLAVACALARVTYRCRPSAKKARSKERAGSAKIGNIQ